MFDDTRLLATAYLLRELKRQFKDKRRKFLERERIIG